MIYGSLVGAAICLALFIIIATKKAFRALNEPHGKRVYNMQTKRVWMYFLIALILDLGMVGYHWTDWPGPWWALGFGVEFAVFVLVAMHIDTLHERNERQPQKHDKTPGREV